MFLLRKDSAKALKAGAPRTPTLPEPPRMEPPLTPELKPESPVTARTLRLVGTVPPETGTVSEQILPKLRTGSDLRIGLEFTVTVKSDAAASLAGATANPAGVGTCEAGGLNDQQKQVID